MGFASYVVAFSFLSGFLYFVSIAPLRRVRRAKRWRETPCVIVAGSVDEDETESGLYRLVVWYSFEADGRTFLCNRYSFGAGSTAGYREKKAVLARLKPGTRTVCYVDPDNPTDAVLHRGVTWDMVVVGVMLSLMLAVFFVFALHDVFG